MKLQSQQRIAADIIMCVGDLLIRDVPEDVLAGLAARAAALGLSRAEYVRRRLTQDGRTADVAVAAADLRRLSEACAGLADPDLMRRAWGE